jgi:hypothetical protein
MGILVGLSVTGFEKTAWQVSRSDETRSVSGEEA